MPANIEQRIAEIERRNVRVEYDKAWETSWTRRILILALTYGVVGFVLSRVHPEYAWIDAMIPCFGYILSTLSISALKKVWIQRHMKQDGKNNDNI
jgi:hypothetical protein